MGVEVFVVAVGRNFDQNELQKIATDRQHVFTVPNFYDLSTDAVRQVITEHICASKLLY